MKKFLLFSLLVILSSLNLYAQNSPKREFRGAWIATYTNIDWPNKTQTPQQQRDAFIVIANHHQQTGMNALFIQVRSQADAMYESAIEPWSADLTGTQGLPPNPFWDPMKFMVDESHKRGMEFHAWINPYRAVGNTANLPNFSPKHVAKQHPEWMLTVGTLQILNPGLAAVRDYVTSVIVDILKRYDVDGIHFDDYFYPSGTINDNDAFNADPRGFTVRADWRRDNIDMLIERVYDSVKSIKPWVKFGISPSGIYRNSTDPNIGSATSGLEHYTTYYADTKKWLQRGWVDYMCPQLYWYIGQPNADYKLLVPWWNNIANGRHIYIAMAGYKVADPSQGASWALASQIPDQVRMNRSYPNVFGQAIYNTTSVRSNKLGFRDSLRLNFYSTPALLPTMAWRDSIAPQPPANLTVTKLGNNSVVLNWNKPPATANELDKAKRFVIYRSQSAVIDLTNADNILAITPNDTTAYTDTTIAADVNYYYTVTSLDRFQNESLAANTFELLPLTLLDFTANKTSEVNVKVQWSTAREDRVKHYEIERSLDAGNFLIVGKIVARNSNRNEHYSFTDITSGITGTLYYRLKMVDKDGQFSYSQMKTINKQQNVEMV
ncbi:MAG: family 10 glycosylhydrolase, partial [Segetibacter sp.]